MSEALEVHATTVARGRQRFVEEGLEAALRPRLTTRRYKRKLDGQGEAHLIALACGPRSSQAILSWSRPQPLAETV